MDLFRSHVTGLERARPAFLNPSSLIERDQSERLIQDQGVLQESAPGSNEAVSSSLMETMKDWAPWLLGVLGAGNMAAKAAVSSNERKT
jgi:hypothetical protein